MKKYFLAYLLVAVVCAIYLSNLLKIDSNYLPVWSDEVHYYKNVRSFYENHSLRAVFSLTENGSKIFGGGPHGIAFPIVYGMFQKTLGWSNLNFIYLNYIVIIISLILVCSRKYLSYKQKTIYVLLFLLYPYLLYYLCSFMLIDVINILFAVVVSLKLYNIFRYNSISNEATFILILIVASFFRPTWMFWYIALIPLSKSGKQFISRMIIFIILFFCSVVISNLFFEQIPTRYPRNVFNQIQNVGYIYALQGIFHKFCQGGEVFFTRYVSFPYTVMKACIVFPLVYFGIKGLLYRRNMLYISISLAIIFNILLFLALYPGFIWSEIRHLAVIYYFSVIFLIIDGNKYVLYPFVAILLMAFLLSLPEGGGIIDKRMSKNYSTLIRNMKANQYIFDLIDDENANVVYLKSAVRKNMSMMLELPITNSKHIPIKYVVPTYRKRFRFRYGKVNYILNKDFEKARKTTNECILTIHQLK